MTWRKFKGRTYKLKTHFRMARQSLIAQKRTRERDETHIPKFWCHRYWLKNAKRKWILYLLDLVVGQRTHEVTRSRN